MTVAPVGGDWHAVSLRGSGETTLWPSVAIDFLSACGDFKPLAGHVQDYAEYHALGDDQLREVAHWTGKMLAHHLLIDQSSVIARCIAAATSEPETPARVGSIAIPTTGDEPRLRRVITSFARNAREHDRPLAITVSFNGPPARAAATGELIASLARTEAVPITLLDEQHRLSLADTLARKASVDPDIARYALSDVHGAGFACGANRNALLLRHAGRPYLSLDDDMACEMSLPAGQEKEEGMLVFSSRDGFERWFYPEYAQAFEARLRIDCDYLALHEQMLGRRVAGFFAAGANIDFVGISDAMLRRLQEQDGRIVTTFTGHCGHPGVPTSYYYLTYRKKTLERLTGAGEAQYRAYLASGGVCALAPRMAIADSSLSPGMAFGVDARALVPPFPPVMHAEDFVWGAAVWQCCAAGFAGHLPIAARHDPGPGRGIIAPPLAQGRPVALWEFAHLLRGILMGWMAAPGALDTAGRMDSAGRYLCDIASAPEKEFHEYLRWFVIQHESDKIGFMESCLTEEHAAPDFWRRDIEAYIEQTRHALADPDCDIPFDMREKWTALEARSLIQKQVSDYGRLLRTWPALFDAALLH
jgi:hypothetical protein